MREPRRTLTGTLITIALAALCAAIATWVPQTAPWFFAAVLALVLLLGMMAAVPRGR